MVYCFYCARKNVRIDGLGADWTVPRLRTLLPVRPYGRNLSPYERVAMSASEPGSLRCRRWWSSAWYVANGVKPAGKLIATITLTAKRGALGRLWSEFVFGY